MGNVQWGVTTSEGVKRLQNAIGHQVTLFTGFQALRISLKELVYPTPEDTTTLLKRFPTGSAPGAFFFDKVPNTLWILCAENTVVGCTLLQVDGKKLLTPDAFVNGYQKKKQQPGSAAPSSFESFELEDHLSK